MMLRILMISIVFLFNCIPSYASDQNDDSQSKKIDYSSYLLNVGSSAAYYTGQSLSSVASYGADMFATAIRKSMPYESYVENIRDNGKLFRDIETFIQSDAVYSDEFVKKIKKLRNRSYYGALYLLKNCDTKITSSDTQKNNYQDSEEIILDSPLQNNATAQDGLLSARNSLNNIYEQNKPVLKTVLNEKLYSYASSGNKNHFLRVSSGQLHKVTNPKYALTNLLHANYFSTHNDFKELITIGLDSSLIQDLVERESGVNELCNAIYEQQVLHNTILNEVSKVYMYSAKNNGMVIPPQELSDLNKIKQNHQARGRIAPLYGQLLDFGLDLGTGNKKVLTDQSTSHLIHNAGRLMGDFER